MNKLRLRFTKTSPAVYISHLDLMRMFQRVFLRAGIKVWHTEGFNPHAYIAIALPLPIFHESCCEILDFAMPDDWNADELSSMASRLNAAMPHGIIVHEVYVPERPIKQLKYVKNEIIYTFDNGAGASLPILMSRLFEKSEIVIQKKSKKGGMKDMDIRPLIKSIDFSLQDENRIICSAVLEAMDTYLNPVYVTTAVENEIKGFAPDQVDYKRLEVYDADMNVFR